MTGPPALRAFFPVVFAALLAGAVLSACAITPPGAAPDAALDSGVGAEAAAIDDPYESTNRDIFDFNQHFDRAVAQPLAKGYVKTVPKGPRRSLRNFLNNLRTPVIFANDVLQAEVSRAGITLGRVVINSTIGIGGLFDVASKIGLPFHNEDFGQTLAVWGVPAGPYLMLPILGPSNPRDAVGFVADIFLDPLTYVFIAQDAAYAIVLRIAVDGVERRSRLLKTLDEIKRGALDFYATVRSLYRQRRIDDIRNGGRPAAVPGPSILTEHRGTAAGQKR